MFKKATKKQAKLRLLLEGPSGSGKTYSALTLAKGFGLKTALIDTEKSSAALYAGTFEFDTCDLSPPFTPERYIRLIKEAEEAGYELLVIDSISHEWNGEGGCLDIQSQLGGRYQDWAKVTPRHNAFINCILQTDMHIIGTARTKSDYAVDMQNGKMKVTKMGTKTEQRDGLEFEFTSVLRLNMNNLYEASKDRTGLFIGNEGKITEETAKDLISWLNDGEEVISKLERKDMAATKLANCSTVDELKDAWIEIDQDLKSELTKLKDDMKNSLIERIATEDIDQ